MNIIDTKPKQLSRTTIYESKWINLYTDRVEFPDGHIIEKMHVLDYPSEAAGAIVLNSHGNILLEYTYRYHTNTEGWEIPAGGIEKGETILEAAKREVLEETGYETKEPKLIYSYNPSCGSSNQIFHIIKCIVTNKPQVTFDKNEVNTVKWFTENEVKQMIEKNEIRDGFSLCALLLHLMK